MGKGIKPLLGKNTTAQPLKIGGHCIGGKTARQSSAPKAHWPISALARGLCCGTGEEGAVEARPGIGV